MTTELAEKSNGFRGRRYHRWLVKQLVGKFESGTPRPE